jgi:hypothetical protein
MRRRVDSTVLIDGKEVMDYRQCAHCGGHFPIKPGSGKFRGFCMNCGGMVCGLRCAECMHWEKKFDLYEAGKLKHL